MQSTELELADLLVNKGAFKAPASPNGPNTTPGTTHTHQTTQFGSAVARPPRTPHTAPHKPQTATPNLILSALYIKHFQPTLRIHPKPVNLAPHEGALGWQVVGSRCSSGVTETASDGSIDAPFGTAGSSLFLFLVSVVEIIFIFFAPPAAAGRRVRLERRFRPEAARRSGHSHYISAGPTDSGICIQRARRWIQPAAAVAVSDCFGRHRGHPR